MWIEVQERKSDEKRIALEKNPDKTWMRIALAVQSAKLFDGG